jgi:outer membrane receptor protein involved in Fe transport
MYFAKLHNWSRVFILLAGVLCLSVAVSAQYDTGSIVGTVHDQTGAVLADATVKITNVKTGRVYEVRTSAAGGYEVPGLPAGTYKVEADHAGFKAGIVSDIVLYATDRRNTEIRLSLGSVTEQVTVVADTVAVDTQSSATGASIDSNKVTNLPLNGRDFTSLIALVPGSVTTGAFGQNSLGGFETTFAGVNVLLDGADATRIDVNATSTQLGRQASRISRASIDSIQEFKVLSSTYSAEYGRSTGDIVNVITKSGGNSFHGTAFEYFRNDAMDAKNFFATQTTPLHLNQFGGNLGGPMVKEKLFFFVNYEGVRQIVNLPTGPVAVLSDATRTKFVPSMFPVRDALPHSNSTQPVILPDGTARPDLAYFFGNLRNTIREDTGSVKVDYNAGVKDTFSFRYNIADSFTSTQYGIAANQVSPSPSRNHLLKGTWNHTFLQNLLNEFGIAFNRPETESLGGGGNFPIFQCFFCSSTNSFGAAPGPALFSNRRPQHSLQFLDTLSWIKGRHAIRSGLDIRHVVTHDALDPQDFLSYAGINDFLNNNGFVLSTLGHTMVGVHNTNYGFFVQDDFRATSRLTLNLGLRYEYNSVLQGDLIGNFNIATLTLDPIGQPLYKPDRNNFAPRVGFAWDPIGNGKTSIRAGFGVFYNPLLTGAALSLAGNYQQGFNVNIIDLLFGVRSCNPPLTSIQFPVPNPLPTCTPPLPANVNSLDPNMRDTYAMHWSLGVQHEVLRNTILEVSYVGNRGVKLPAGAAYAGQELNLAPFGGPNQLSNCTPTQPTCFGQIRRLGNFVNSNFHSLQASLRRRVAKGVNIDANYTYAHEIDDAVNILTGAYQNSHNPRGDYGSGDIDVRHNFTLGAVWDIPAPGNLPKRLAEGWQISSLLQARGGLPFTIALNAPFLGIDQLRPNLVPGQSVRPSDYSVPGDKLHKQLNFSAFAAPPAGQFGNVGRNTGRGPGFAQIDFAVMKTTRIRENLSFQFRGELFNIFNHPNFANPDGVLSDLTFGESTSTVGNLVGTGTSRQAQLVVKFIF